MSGECGGAGPRTADQEVDAAFAHFQNAEMAVDDGVTFSEDQAMALREMCQSIRMGVDALQRGYNLRMDGDA